MEVSLVRWPEERHRRERLHDEGRPCLLLVASDAEPPEPVGCLEDWIRVPATDGDVERRIAGLATRSANHAGVAAHLDDDGVLRCGGSWVSLPPVEARLTAALLERIGAVVSRDALARAGWPEGAPGRNALDVHVLRLRRRLRPIGLAIRTVRSRGYLLEVSDSRQQDVNEA